MSTYNSKGRRVSSAFLMENDTKENDTWVTYAGKHYPFYFCDRYHECFATEAQFLAMNYLSDEKAYLAFKNREKTEEMEVYKVKESRPGLVTEIIDEAAYREFMLGL